MIFLPQSGTIPENDDNLRAPRLAEDFSRNGYLSDIQNSLKIIQRAAQ